MIESFDDDRYRSLFDHVDYLKNKFGYNNIIAQPYYSDEIIELANEWARKNGCKVEEYRDHSWNSPPETTLLLFRKKRNPFWWVPRARNRD